MLTRSVIAASFCRGVMASSSKRFRRNLVEELQTEAGVSAAAAASATPVAEETDSAPAEAEEEEEEKPEEFGGLGDLFG